MIEAFSIHVFHHLTANRYPFLYAYMVDLHRHITRLVALSTNFLLLYDIISHTTCRLYGSVFTSETHANAYMTTFCTFYLKYNLFPK